MVLNVCFVGKSFSCRSFCTGVFDMTLGWSLVTFIHAYESPGNGSKVFGAIGTSFSEDTWAHEAVGQGGSLEQNKAIRRKPKKDAYRSPHKRTGSTVICNVSKRYTVDCRCCCFPVFQPHESWNYIYIYIFPYLSLQICRPMCSNLLPFLLGSCQWPTVLHPWHPVTKGTTASLPRNGRDVSCLGN